MPRLRFHMLGPPRIEFDGSAIEVDTRKAIALAAYLILNPDPQPRDKLAATFWPEADQPRAHAALRRTLSVLNKSVDGVGLTIDRDLVTIRRGPDVWLDVDDFHAHLAQCEQHGHAPAQVCVDCRPHLQAAATLYRDDFMAGFSLRDSPAFDDWQFFQGERLRREQAGALECLVAALQLSEQTEAAIQVARRWLALDPIHEPAHNELMRLYARAGQQAAALRQYQECVRVLEAELGVLPLAETTQLYESIKQARLRPDILPTDTSLPAARAPHPERPAPQAKPQSPGADLPLVGRAAEWSSLLTAYRGAQQAGQFVVIEGEAGIGKTRLAEALVEYTREQGGLVASARCFEGEAGLAYGPFVELLRSLVRQASFAGRLGALAPRQLSEAARLLPELAEAHSGLPPAAPLDSPGAQSRFFEAIAQLLTGMEDGSPAVIFFDDVHWMDEASLGLLTYLVRRLRGRRLLALVTWRSEQVPAGHRMRLLLADAQRMGAGQGISLARLSREYVAELLQSTLDARRARQVEQRLYQESEGLPLFVAEYLAALKREPAEGSEGWPLPLGVRGLLQSRLAAADERARQLLSAAAVIGRSFDFATLQAVSGRSQDETLAGLESLMLLGLVHDEAERGGALLYDFNHDKLRELAYEESSLARRRLLHRRAAEALAAGARAHPASPALAGQVATHFRLSGNPLEAARHYVLAGDAARALYANAEALGHYNAALALGHPDPAALHERIGDLQTLAGAYGEAIESYRRAALGSPAAIQHKLGNVYARRGDGQAAADHFRAALAALGENGAPGNRARVLADWSLSAHRGGDSDQALRLGQQSLSLADDAGDPRALAQARNILGILASSRKDYSTARRHLEASLALAEGLNDDDAQVAALNNLALACRAADQLDEAARLTERALALCAARGDRHREAALHNNLADLMYAAGQTEAAMGHLKQAVALFAEVGSDPADRDAWQPEIWKLTEW